MNTTIPKVNVYMGPKDRPCVTPYIKHLINKCWSAFQNKDYNLYNSLKVAVKAHIIKARRNWARNVSKTSNLWKAVKSVNQTSTDNLCNLLSDFPNVKDATEVINEALCNGIIPSNCNVDLPVSNVSSHFTISESMVFKYLCNIDCTEAY